MLQVTIRLLDPPLHEFLPTGEMTEVVEQLAHESGVTKDKVLEKIDKLHEVLCLRSTKPGSVDANLPGRSTLCWASEVAGSASFTRRSLKCR